jgi:hypothetical protein
MVKTIDTKYHKRAQHVLMICIGLAMLVGGFFIPAGVKCEEQKVIPEWIMPQHYPPAGFDGYGLINRISAEEVVIDDDLFKLDRSVTYVTPTNTMSSHSNFKMGDLVGYLKNSQHEVMSLWLIEKKKP